MKRILGYLVLWAFPLFCFGQDGIDAINDIKLSGKYFTAEAPASTEDDAKKLALMGLMEKLSAYCEEMEIEWNVRDPSEALRIVCTESEVWHELPVHHIDMKEFKLCLLKLCQIVENLVKSCAHHGCRNLSRLTCRKYGCIANCISHYMPRFLSRALQT